MLAAISKTTQRCVLAVCAHTAEAGPSTPRRRSTPISDAAECPVIIDVDELWRAVVPTRPDIVQTWGRVSDVCGRAVSPVYRAVQTALLDDCGQLADLFDELESGDDEDCDDTLDIGDQCPDDCDDAMYAGLNCVRQRNAQPSTSSKPFCEFESLLSSSDPSIPSIVLTPCASPSAAAACWVPFQDASFGSRLVVPAHAVANAVFPPLVPSAPALKLPGQHQREWRWAHGHWWAVLPSPEEQARSGLFSRVVAMGRKKGGHGLRRGRTREGGEQRRGRTR